MFVVRKGSSIAGLSAAALGLLMAMPVTSASAQVGEFFESLFGGLRRASQQIHQPSPRLDPNHQQRSVAREGGGQAYCVRTCDGRFFPLQRHASMVPAELCRSFCPSSATKVFYGGSIERAYSGAERYTDLPNAFVYRQRMVDNCTCNGRDALGLAKVDIAHDDTLRPGDIVATKDGLATYRGRDRDQSARFSPIDPSSSEWARRLSETEVRPAPAVTSAQPVAYTPIPVAGDPSDPQQRTVSR